MDSVLLGRITRTERKKKIMKPKAAEKKKPVRKKKTAAPKTVVKQSYFIRKRRVLTLLWARIDKIEEQVPKSLEEAVEISRQSRRLRKRLAKFTKLKAVAFPTYALVVDCWGKEVLMGAGTRNKMEALIDGSDAIRNAGYKMICLSDLADGKQQVNEMKFMQGKENEHPVR